MGVAITKWRLAAIVGGVIFAIGALIAVLSPRSYYAEALLVIHPVQQNLAQPQDPRAILPPDTSAIDTEVEILRSPAIARRVVNNLQLYKDPAFGGNASALPNSEAAQKAETTVQANTRIRRVGLTYAIQVGYVAGSKDMAKRVANNFVSAYLQSKLDEKLASVSSANHDLGSTLKSLRLQALQAESKLQDYRIANNLLTADGTTLTEGELSALNQRIADAQADAAEKQARVSAALSQAHSGSGGSDVGATLASGTIGALRQKEAEASAELSQLEAQFRPEYPPVVKAKAQLNDIRAQLRAETSRILSSLRADAQVAQQREASLMSSRKSAEDRLGANNRARVGLLTLQQDADASKKIYETYLSRATEVTAARNLQQVDANLESKAQIQPAGPLSSMKFALAMAAFLAMVGAAIAILISELWNSRIRSWHDVERNTGLPLIGAFPDVDTRRDPTVQVSGEPLTAFAEAFRNLRAYLSLSARPELSKMITVTSAVPGEGKTMLSVCLAKALAANGSRVVLVDCDLRRASASKFFEMPRYGLAEVIQKRAPVEQAIRRDEKAGIFFMPGTTTGERSGDLFTSPRLDEVLKFLTREFDHVVIDTAPVLGFADARILASKASRVLFAVRWNSTPASMVRSAIGVLHQCNARIAGIVLNKIDGKEQSRFGFADGSNYYHLYGLPQGQQG
jgi:capsular exopolysaccharide synthesis family protein